MTECMCEKIPGCFEIKRTEYLLCEKCAEEAKEWLERYDGTDEAL